MCACVCVCEWDYVCIYVCMYMCVCVGICTYVNVGGWAGVYDLYRFCLQHHINLQWSVPIILAFQRRRQQDHKVKVILEQNGKLL